jgi:hypothetical protein
MRAGESPGAETVLSKQPFDESGGAGLAIGSSDMDDSINLLWVTK